MKNLLKIGIIFFSLQCYSQIVTQGLDSDLSHAMYTRNQVSSLENKDVKGSKYIDTNFVYAEVSEKKTSAYIRYNAVSDIIEFKLNEKEIYNLIKDENYNVIIIKSKGIKYRLLNYISESKPIYGYLLEIASNNNFSLLKHQKIKLRPEKKASSPYDSDSPAEYIRLSDEYYLELPDQKIIAMPKNKKGFIEIFPDKKDSIEDYFKTKKVDFKNDSSLIDLIKIL